MHGGRRRPPRPLVPRCPRRVSTDAGYPSCHPADRPRRVPAAPCRPRIPAPDRLVPARRDTVGDERQAGPAPWSRAACGGVSTDAGHPGRATWWTGPAECPPRRAGPGFRREPVRSRAPGTCTATAAVHPARPPPRPNGVRSAIRSSRRGAPVHRAARPRPTADAACLPGLGRVLRPWAARSADGVRTGWGWRVVLPSGGVCPWTVRSRAGVQRCVRAGGRGGRGVPSAVRGKRPRSGPIARCLGGAPPEGPPGRRPGAPRRCRRGWWWERGAPSAVSVRRERPGGVPVRRVSGGGARALERGERGGPSAGSGRGPGRPPPGARALLRPWAARSADGARTGGGGARRAVGDGRRAAARRWPPCARVGGAYPVGRRGPRIARMVVDTAVLRSRAFPCCR